MSESLKSEILAGYKALGGCKDIYRELCAAPDRDALVSVYLTHPDWCMELGFPSLNYIRKNFSDLENRNIYVDREFYGEVINVQTAVFHNCGGHIKVEMDYDNSVIPMLYFCNGCSIHVECQQTNVPAIRVPLYIFGKNLVTINGHNNATFIRHEHDIV